MFRFIASRAASFICATVLAMSAIALLVTCYVVGSEDNAPAAPAPAPAKVDTVATLKDAPTGCQYMGTLSCADNMTDLLAKDAFDAYAEGSDQSYKDTLTSFAITYERTITNTGTIDPATEIAIPSQNFPHTFHVFKISK